MCEDKIRVMSVPTWAKALSKRGLYYEGFVEDAQSLLKFNDYFVSVFTSEDSQVSTLCDLRSHLPKIILKYQKLKLWKNLKC